MARQHTMLKEVILSPYVEIIILVILSTLDAPYADPRAHTVKLMCGSNPEHNASTYVSNFVSTMENISVQMRTSGYGVSRTGSGLDASYGLAQCYGDLSSVDCVLCYAEARTVLPQCFPSSGGRIFLDGCFMRTENYSFYEDYTGPEDHAICGNTTLKNSAFEVTMKQALLQSVAASDDGYARVQVGVSGSNNQSAYVLADCWHTISASSCRACLENASASLLGCLPWSEGWALNTGCFMRYSDTDFLNPVPGTGGLRGKKMVVVIAVVGVAAVFVIGASIGIYVWRQRTIERKRKGSGEAEKFDKILSDNGLNFKYSTLEKATGFFNEANKLGQGGFGTVYKGVLADGREIAVKRLFFNNKHRAAQFYNEVKIVSSVEHKNLVRLLGCSCLGPESLLVYEFLPNKSLDRFIFDSNKGKALNWEKRLEIIIGTAEGLVYLHENTKARIIHRDIKASNILLDSRLRAKIADFGLARSFEEDKTHISTAIAGTLGYMAPEYLAHGHLTEKVDVYSFGVLLLEIASGRQNNRSQSLEYSESLLTIAWRHFQLGSVEEMIDPNLKLHNYYIRNEVVRVIHVGLLCTQEASLLRPSMSKALQMLVIKDEDLPAPANPPFMDDKTMELNENKSAASIASVSQSIFYPR